MGRELELRPRRRPADLREAAPGLFVVQHAGGDKAKQYFLRGFDADHGTDIAFSLDGVPLNNVSHGHGQGYTDLNFIIPELVVGVDVYIGPYAARFGDFATAVRSIYAMPNFFPEHFTTFTLGQFGIVRGLVVASPKLGEDCRTVLAADMYRQDGPFENPERLRRFNAVARFTHDLSPSSKLTTRIAYGSRWNGSGQIPARAVCGEGESGLPRPEGQPRKSSRALTSGALARNERFAIGSRRAFALRDEKGTQ